MALPIAHWTTAELDAGYEALAAASPFCRMAGRWALSAQLVALRSEINEEIGRRLIDQRAMQSRQLSLVPRGYVDEPA